MKTIVPFLLLGGWLALNTAWSQAQPDTLLFQQFTTKDGLPHNFVNDIQRDNRGFIWVATVKGVSRFDGFQFTNYLHETQDAPNWGLFGFHDLSMDKTGRIWVTNHEKLFWFDEKQDRFREFPLPPAMQEKLVLMDFPGSDAVWLYQNGNIYTINATSFHIDSLTKAKYRRLHNVQLDPQQQRIWFGGHHRADTIQIYDIRKKTWTRLPFHQKDYNKSTWGFYEDKKGRLWVGSERLARYDPATGQWVRWGIKNEQGQELYNYKLILPLCSDSLLWMFNNNYLRCFDTRSQTFSRQYFGAAQIVCTLAEQHGDIWLGTENGLFYRNHRRPLLQWDNIFNSKNQSDEKWAGVGPPIQHRTNKNWSWLACYGQGVALYDMRERKIIRRFLDPAAGTPLEWNSCYYVFALRSHRIWVVAMGGIAALNERDGTYSVVTKDPQFHWIGNAATDPEGNLWFEQKGQFYISDSVENKFYPVNLPFVKQLTAAVRGICFDRSGNLWVLTNNELLRYELSSQRYRLVSIDWSLVEQPGKRQAVDFGVDTSGNPWISTRAGLFGCNFERGLFHLYDYRHGFSSGYGEEMAIDANQNIWMSSRFGLFCFDTQMKRFVKIRLPGIETEATMSIEAVGPMVWLSAAGGRSLLFASHQFESYPTPQPLVTALRVHGQAFAFDADSVARYPIRLDYRQNVLTFDFTAIDFEQGGALQFEYRLDPFDRDWVQCGTKRSVTYTSLDGGNYSFRVRAVSEWGQRSEWEAVVRLRVLPPFYRTWWFFTLCGAALVGIFFGIFRYRELQRLEKEKIRQRIARDLHDDVGSTLSSISILSDSALTGAKQGAEKQRLDHIGEKARSALDSLSDIVWAVNPQNDSMEKVIAQMTRLAVETLEPSGIVVDVRMDKKANALKLPMEQRKEFYLIFKEAVNNCAKHSKAKSVRISLTLEADILKLEIADDGAGFDPVNQSAGNGLQNMRARAETLAGTLDLRTQHGQGTAVILSLPLIP